MNFTSNGWTQFLPTAFLLNPYYFMHWCSLAQECLSHTPFTSPNLAQFLKALANSIFSLRFPNPSCNWILGKVSLCHFVVHHLFYLVISLNSLFVPFLLSIAHSTLPCIQQVFCICWMNERKHCPWFKKVNMNKSAVWYCVYNNYSTPGRYVKNKFEFIISVQYNTKLWQQKINTTMNWHKYAIT